MERHTELEMIASWMDYTRHLLTEEDLTDKERIALAVSDLEGSAETVRKLAKEAR